MDDILKTRNSILSQAFNCTPHVNTVLRADDVIVFAELKEEIYIETCMLSKIICNEYNMKVAIAKEKANSFVENKSSSTKLILEVPVIGQAKNVQIEFFNFNLKNVPI